MQTICKDIVIINQ